MGRKSMTEMEGNYGYGQEKTAGNYCPINTSIDLSSDALPHKQGTYPPAVYGNELVDYLTGSLQKSSSEADSHGSIDDIFEDRLDLIRSKKDLILLQLSQRKKIHHKVIYRIEKNSCKAYDLLSAWGMGIYRVDNDRLKIEQIKFDLDQQKRREDTDYFNDTSLLNRELREALIQYQEEIQKNSLISGMEVSE